MIKEQPMIKQEPHFEGVFYCLNPFCGDQLNRKFRNDDRHLVREQCKKWIIDQDALCAQHEPLQAKTINNIHIDFQEQPLKAFELLLRLRESDWRKVLEAEQAKTKKEIMRSIQVEFEAVRQKMENLLDNASLFSRACHIAEDNHDPSALLNDFYQHHLPEIDALHSRMLFKRMQLKQAVGRVKEQIENIFESIIEEQNSDEAGASAHQQQRQFHEFVFQQSSEYFNKVQILATALKKPEPSFKVEGQTMLLECCLCQRSIRTPAATTANGKKAVKKYLAEQILTHIYCSHHGEVAFAYTHKVAKSLLVPLTFQQFVTQSRKSKRITIVDRESGVTYEEQYSAQGGSGFTVEVISVKNAGMARGRHILVQNHLSTDCLVAILSYVCTQRDQNVEIVTNRPALKTGIEDLLWCHIKEEQLIKTG